jgi:hypothetical protein
VLAIDPLVELVPVGGVDDVRQGGREIRRCDGVRAGAHQGASVFVHEFRRATNDREINFGACASRLTDVNAVFAGCLNPD